MKTCGFKKNFKKRTHIYFSGRILIKSDAKLSKQQRKDIFNIVRENRQNSYYGCDKQIPREIFHKLKGYVHFVEFYETRFGSHVKIESSKAN